MRRLAPFLLAAAPAAAGEAWVTEQGSGTLSVIDLDTNAVNRALEIGGAPAGVAVGPDAVWVVSPETKRLHRIDPETGALTSLALEGGPFGVAVSPDGRTVYVTDWFGARVHVVRDGAVVGEIATGESPSGVAAAGGLVVTADRDSDRLTLTDAATLEPVATVPVGARPFGVTLDPGTRRAYVANVGDDTVSVVDLDRAEAIGAVPVGERPYEVALANGRGFVSNSYGDSVTVFDLVTLEPLAEIAVGEYPEGVEATASGDRVYVANWFSNSVSVIDTETLEVVEEIAVGDGPRAFGDFLRE